MAEISPLSIAARNRHVVAVTLLLAAIRQLFIIAQHMSFKIVCRCHLKIIKSSKQTNDGIFWKENWHRDTVNRKKLFLCD